MLAWLYITLIHDYHSSNLSLSVPLVPFIFYHINNFETAVI